MLAADIGKAVLIAIACAAALAAGRALWRLFWRAMRREVSAVVGDVIAEHLMKPNGGGSLYDLRVSVDAMSQRLGEVEANVAGKPPPPPPIGGTWTG